MPDKNEILFFKKKRYFEYPKMLQIEITNRCPLKCPQCYKDSGNYKDMPLAEINKIIDEAKEIGIKKIMINGGEPLLHPNFIDIVRKITDNNLTSVCYTSGYGITSEIIEWIQKSNIEMAISFNGSNEKIHNLSRDGFKISMRAIRLLQEHNMKYRINWVARHDNINDFENVIALGKKYQADGVIVVGNKLAGDGKVYSELTREDYDKLKKIIKKPENERYIAIQNCYNLLAQYVYDMPKSKTFGCSAGITACYITVNGGYAPCSHLYYEERWSGILEYWANSKVLQELRRNETYLLSHCSSCRRSEKCRFCRAVSEKSHSNFQSGYEKCPIYE